MGATSLRRAAKEALRLSCCFSASPSSWSNSSASCRFVNASRCNGPGLESKGRRERGEEEAGNLWGDELVAGHVEGGEDEEVEEARLPDEGLLGQVDEAAAEDALDEGAEAPELPTPLDQVREQERLLRLQRRLPTHLPPIQSLASCAACLVGRDWRMGCGTARWGRGGEAP